MAAPATSTLSTAPISVARVSAIQGEVFAKGADGGVRPLRVGDYLYEGEVVVTRADSFVDLTTLDGQPLTLGDNDTLTMDAEVLGRIAPDGTDSAVRVSGDDLDRIVTALNEGRRERWPCRSSTACRKPRTTATACRKPRTTATA